MSLVVFVEHDQIILNEFLLTFCQLVFFLNALESFHFFFFIILSHTHLNILISTALISTLPIFSACPSLNKEGKFPREGDDKGKI